MKGNKLCDLRGKSILGVKKAYAKASWEHVWFVLGTMRRRPLPREQEQQGDYSMSSEMTI